MTASPSEATQAPRKVTLYRNGSVYTAADPFATAMLPSEAVRYADNTSGTSPMGYFRATRRKK